MPAIALPGSSVKAVDISSCFLSRLCSSCSCSDMISGGLAWLLLSGSGLPCPFSFAKKGAACSVVAARLYRSFFIHNVTMSAMIGRPTPMPTPRPILLPSDSFGLALEEAEGEAEAEASAVLGSDVEVPLGVATAVDAPDVVNWAVAVLVGASVKMSAGRQQLRWPESQLLAQQNVVAASLQAHM